MYNAILSKFEGADIIIKSAAVADYKPSEYSEKKIKKGSQGLELNLIRDRDILKTLGEQKKKNQIIIGFAAESHDLIKNAQSKLEKKNLDYIVANNILSKDTGFGTDNNKVTIIGKEGFELSLEKMSKREVAKNIFDLIKGR